MINNVKQLGKILSRKEMIEINGNGIFPRCEFPGQHCRITSSSGTYSGTCNERLLCLRY